MIHGGDLFRWPVAYGIGTLLSLIGGGGPPPATDALLLEDGFFFLLEDGSHLLLG
jgi:hypothetical protein